MAPPIAKTPEMVTFETAFVEKCKTQFAGMSDNTKAACIAVINSINAADVIKTNVETITTTQKAQKAQLDTLAGTMTTNQQIATARSFVNEWVDKWQTKATVFHAAVTVASAEYDLILQTRATQPISPAWWLGLALSFLPELQIFEGSFKALVMKKRSPILTRAFRRKGLKPVVSVGQQIAQQLDQKSLEVLELTALLFNSGDSDIDDASAQLQAAYSAKNNLFQGMLNNIVENLIRVTNIAQLCYLYLNTTMDTNALQVVSGMMEDNALPHDYLPIYTGLFGLLSKQLLYDMLRDYAKRYVSGTVSAGLGYDEGDRIVFEGLDDAQMDLIAARFNWRKWKPSGDRPNINGAESMVSNWQLPTKEWIMPRAG